MPKMDGIELLGELKKLRPETIVIIMTAHSTWERAVEAMRLGAYDYLKKPFCNDELKALIKRALAYSNFFDNDESWNWESCRLIGVSKEIKHIHSLIKKVAATDGTVVIQGDSGVGKEMVARLLHANSFRAGEPLISVNCGAFTESLLESELFGHIKGAFTGAIANKKGLVQVAENGTLFLDEVAEMSPHTQVRFLRLLENREYSPVGSSETIKINVRFITATNRNLEDMVADKTFREDLYYRLNVIPITIPPLRERKEDIPLLAGYFLAKYAKKQNSKVVKIGDELLSYLLDHNWPGNIRELENTIQRAITFCHDEELKVEDIECIGSRSPIVPRKESITSIFTEGFSLDSEVEKLEKNLIKEALEETGGSITNAADILGITFRQLRYKIKKLGM